MKRFFSLILSLLILSCTLLAGCCMRPRQPFAGGNPITPEELEVLSAEMFAPESDTVLPDTEGPDGIVSGNPPVLPEQESPSGEGKRGTVYWLPGSEVYHKSASCRYLKGKHEVESGCVDEAVQQGKKRPCSVCGNPASECETAG